MKKSSRSPRMDSRKIEAAAKLLAELGGSVVTREASKRLLVAERESARLRAQVTALEAENSELRIRLAPLVEVTELLPELKSLLANGGGARSVRHAIGIGQRLGAAKMRQIADHLQRGVELATEAHRLFDECRSEVFAVAQEAAVNGIATP